MKTIIKSIAAAAIFLAAGTVANAQVTKQTLNSATTNLNVSAKVLKQITIASQQNITFGAIGAGTVAYLSPDPAVGNSNVAGPTPALGTIVLSASEKEYVGIEFPLSVVMDHTNSSINDKVVYVPQVSVRKGTQTDKAGAVFLGETSTYTTTDPATITGTPTTGTGGMGEALGTAAGFVTTHTDAVNPSDDEKVTLFFGGWIVGSTNTPPIVRGTTPTEVIGTVATGNYSGTVTVNLNYYL